MLSISVCVRWMSAGRLARYRQPPAHRDTHALPATYADPNCPHRPYQLPPRKWEQQPSRGVRSCAQPVRALSGSAPNQGYQRIDTDPDLHTNREGDTVHDQPDHDLWPFNTRERLQPDSSPLVQSFHSTASQPQPISGPV